MQQANPGTLQSTCHAPQGCTSCRLPGFIGCVMALDSQQLRGSLQQLKLHVQNIFVFATCFYAVIKVTKYLHGKSQQTT
jgi:hypothetical protein